jgi:hypothetical protein
VPSLCRRRRCAIDAEAMGKANGYDGLSEGLSVKELALSKPKIRESKVLLSREHRGPQMSHCPEYRGTLSSSEGREWKRKRKRKKKKKRRRRTRRKNATQMKL